MTQTEQSDRSASGTYALGDGTITFSEVTGRLGGQAFPMTCTLETAEDGAFTLRARDGACEIFDGQTFTPQG